MHTTPQASSSALRGTRPQRSICRLSPMSYRHGSPHPLRLSHLKDDLNFRFVRRTFALIPITTHAFHLSISPFRSRHSRPFATLLSTVFLITFSFSQRLAAPNVGLSRLFCLVLSLAAFFFFFRRRRRSTSPPTRFPLGSKPRQTFLLSLLPYLVLLCSLRPSSCPLQRRQRPTPAITKLGTTREQPQAMPEPNTLHVSLTVPAQAIQCHR